MTNICEILMYDLKIYSKIMTLNYYIEKEISERIKRAEFWKQQLEENGNVLITDKDPGLTFGNMYNNAFKSIDYLKSELEEKKALIKVLEERRLSVAKVEV